MGNQATFLGTSTGHSKLDQRLSRLRFDLAWQLKPPNLSKPLYSTQKAPDGFPAGAFFKLPRSTGQIRRFRWSISQLTSRRSPPLPQTPESGQSSCSDNHNKIFLFYINKLHTLAKEIFGTTFQPATETAKEKFTNHETSVTCVYQLPPPPSSRTHGSIRGVRMLVRFLPRVTLTRKFCLA